ASLGGSAAGAPLMWTITLASSPLVPATTCSSFILVLAQNGSELRLSSSIAGALPVSATVPLTEPLSPGAAAGPPAAGARAAAGGPAAGAPAAGAAGAPAAGAGAGAPAAGAAAGGAVSSFFFSSQPTVAMSPPAKMSANNGRRCIGISSKVARGLTHRDRP